MHDEVTIGARLRVLRRWRGLSLGELAGLAGVSKSWLSMAERGQRPLDRRSVIAALATALKVSEKDLTGGPHLSDDREQSSPHGIVPLLRDALTANTFGEPWNDQARPLDVLQAALRAAKEAEHACDYVRRGELLAPVIGELHTHIATGGEADQARALGLMIEACRGAGMTLRFLGYDDLAGLAAMHAVEAAGRLDDPTLTGQAAWIRAQLLPKGSWDRPLTVATRAAEKVEPASSRTAAEVYGMLQLTAALAASALNRPATADEHLAEAERIGVRIGDPADAWASFGRTNVNIWRVSITLEHGDYEKAIRYADDPNVRPDALPNRERRASFHAERGRAMAHIKSRQPEAVQELGRAEKLAPQRIRNDPRVRETVAVMLEQARSAAGGRDLRGMAARMGVPH